MNEIYEAKSINESNDVITEIAKDISLYGSSSILVSILLISVCVHLVVKKRVRECLFIVLSTLSYPISILIKFLFRNERPEGYDIVSVVNWDNYSFPSSHVFFYSAFFGYLFIISFRKNLFDRFTRNIIRVLSVVMISLVGASRILLGAHYLKDVVFGYIFGFILLFILLGLEKYAAQRSKPKRRE